MTVLNIIFEIAYVNFLYNFTGNFHQRSKENTLAMWLEVGFDVFKFILGNLSNFPIGEMFKKSTYSK